MMNAKEFEKFVQSNGKDILRFCRLTAGDEENGNELYQDTMLALLEKRTGLDAAQNMKSYALSVSIFLWKNKRKKYAVRRRILPMCSLEECMEKEAAFQPEGMDKTPEEQILERSEADEVRALVAHLPMKYKIPIYLNFSANMKMDEIAECLDIPVGTVKTRIRKAKKILKEKLEGKGYDR